MPELTEIVPFPNVGRLFHHPVRVGLADAAPDGRARLDAIARWLQEAAFADVADAGLAELGAWVVRRARIRVERFPRFREAVDVATFCSGLGRLWAERRTILEGEAGARVEAVALWVYLDPGSGRPRRPGNEFWDVYAPSAGGREVKARLRHPSPPESTASTLWSFRAADLDLAGHVNNAAYWEVLEEELMGRGPESFDGEIEHRVPADAGPASLLRAEGMRWVVGDELHASFALA